MYVYLFVCLFVCFFQHNDGAATPSACCSHHQRLYHGTAVRAQGSRPLPPQPNILGGRPAAYLSVPHHSVPVGTGDTDSPVSQPLRSVPGNPNSAYLAWAKQSAHKGKKKRLLLRGGLAQTAVGKPPEGGVCTPTGG